MKKVGIAAIVAVTLSAGASFAGSAGDARMEPEVIEAETSSGNGHLLVPILFLIFTAATAG